MNAIHFFDTESRVLGLFDSLFGGFYLLKGAPLAGQLVWLASIAICLVAAVAEKQTKHPAYGPLSRAAAWNCFLVSFFFLLQPWDELFVNLRHSFYLAENGNFSFNAGENIEGTVDWLVYFLLGLLHKGGLPLVELAFLQALAGAIVCIVLGRKIWMRLTDTSEKTLPTLLFCLFPPLAFNSAHGFTTTWFLAAILGTILGLFFSSLPVLGWMSLSLLGVLRTEGILFALVLGTYAVYLKPKHAPYFFLMLLPFTGLSIWRYTHFGSILAVPILYKATGLHSFYFAIGVRNFIADSIGCLSLLSFLGICLFYRPHERSHLAISIGVCLLLSCLPYYFSGGDWFPSYWGRYLLPVSFWVFLFFTSTAYRYHKTPRPPATLLWVTLAFLLAIHSLWPVCSVHKYFETLFAHRRTLARIHPPTIGRSHYRIQHLSQLGNHLKTTLSPEEVIASSEVATIMFFAERPALDLLGVANPEIARSEPRGVPSFLREFPQTPELPYLIFKRIRPEIVPKKKPEILYTFDFMWRDQMPGIELEELTEPGLLTALGRWKRKFSGLIDELYGGIDQILKWGYQPVLVRYSNQFISLYFVRGDKFEEHARKLKKLGFIEHTWRGL